MKKLLNKRIIVGLVGVIAVVAFFSFKNGDDRNFQLAKNLDIFNAIVKELDMFYVDTIDPNKTIRQGIDNMLLSLDPYTEYFLKRIRVNWSRWSKEVSEESVR